MIFQPFIGFALSVLLGMQPVPAGDDPTPVGGEPVPAAGRAAPVTEKPIHSAPEWTREACWYQVMVPRFRNGDPSNDPPGTRAWTAKWTSKGIDLSPHAVYWDENAERFGGDLAGLQTRLPYLKELGFNALYLSPVFHAPSDHKYDPADSRHVDDSFAVAKSLARITGETHDPTTWKFSASDRLFLDFVKEAHRQGFRVVVEGVFSQAGRNSWAWKDVQRHGRDSAYADWFDVIQWGPPVGWGSDAGCRGRLIRFKRADDGLSSGAEKYVFAVTRRWMDPDGDGNPADGIDGWGVYDAVRLPPKTVQRWQTHVKRINPGAVLVGDWRNAPSDAPFGTGFDLIISNQIGEAIQRFFTIDNKEYLLEGFFDDLAHLGEGRPPSLGRASLNVTGGPALGRVLTALSPQSPGPSGTPAQSPSRGTDAVRSRWRLATVFQHFYPGTPMTYYGDEVGMIGGPGADARTPMWWDDLPGEDAKPADYRRDFAALTLQLHGLRRRFAPLRYGDYRTVLLDEKRHVLAFARTLPGDEVILVMNYGDSRQKVTVPVGKPGQLVGIVNPELKPGKPHPLLKRRAAAQDSTQIPRLRLGGNQQFTDGRGEISLSVKPGAVRILLIRDQKTQ